MCGHPAGGKKGKKGAVNGKKSEESDIFKLVKMIMQRNFDPVQLLPLWSRPESYVPFNMQGYILLTHAVQST